MFEIFNAHLNDSISNYAHFPTGYDTRGQHSLSIAPYQSANTVFEYFSYPRTIVESDGLDAPTVQTYNIKMFGSLLGS